MELGLRDIRLKKIRYISMRFKSSIKNESVFFLGFLYLFLSEFSISEVPKENEWKPDNWYQAEVVIFKHNIKGDDERPPTNFELYYPDRWHKLAMPGIDIDVIDLAKLMEFGRNREVSELRKIDIKSEANNKSPNVPTNIDLLDHITSPLSQVNHIEENYPKFELPYIKLQKHLRNLNETTMVLHRLPQYSVLFHNAWRFPITHYEDDPWVIIEAGSNINSRFELEGSLRFYKSRFLHFESNLWLSEIDPNFGARLTVNFPILEGTRTYENPPQRSLRAAANIRESSFTNIQPNSDNVPTQTRLLMSIAENNEVPHSTDDGLQSIAKSENQNTTANTQLVSALWTIDKSQRLKPSEVHYLDHPKIGIILTIHEHQPLLLNPEEIPVANTDLDQS